jgi:hypothetical protein
MTVHVRWPAKNSGVPHNAGFLAALFFVSFFWASKRKKRNGGLFLFIPTNTNQDGHHICPQHY